MAGKHERTMIAITRDTQESRDVRRAMQVVLGRARQIRLERKLLDPDAMADDYEDLADRLAVIVCKLQD